VSTPALLQGNRTAPLTWSRVLCLSRPYQRVLCAPPRVGICRVCRSFASAGRGGLCPSCRRLPVELDAVLPLSLSCGGGPLHRELRAYKDDRSEVVRDHCTLGLAAVLARFLAEHEACLTRAAQSTGFRLVTTVPSREPRADESRARLREIVGRRCPATAGRFTRVLRAAGADGPSHHYTPARYCATVALEGLDVLLVDDTWTTGASAQAAARALKAAGAHRVALVVIGRHVNPAWADHALRIRGLSAFSWSGCARHAGV